MSLLGTILILACLPQALLDFAMPKWKADESVRIDDAYKYLYQATHGGEHAAPSREAAKKWLDSEWMEMGDEPKGENLWQPLCPGGELGRLNLRPFKRTQGKPNLLLEAFMSSAEQFEPDTISFLQAWGMLGKRLKIESIGRLSLDDWIKFDHKMKEQSYPAVRHSDDYSKANKPAYRVLTREQAHWLIQD